MNFLEIINPNAVDINFDAKDKLEALTHLSQLLEQDGAVADCELFLRDVLLREQEGQTGIGGYVAIPHGKSCTVQKNCVAVGRVKSPIAWETLDGKPVKLIILFAVQELAPSKEHLRMMASVAKILAKEEICKQLVEVSSRQQLFDILSSISK